MATLQKNIILDLSKAISIVRNKIRKLIDRFRSRHYELQLLEWQQKHSEDMSRLFDQVFQNNPVLLLDDVKIYLPLFYKDHIQKTIYRSKNFYEIETLEFLRLHYGNFNTVVDIGSNIGNHMLFYCSRLRSRSVICFEPHPFNRDILEQNVALNHLQDKVQVYGIALGKGAGMASQQNFSHSNTGMNRVHRVEATLDGEQIVEIRSLDSFELNQIDFIKVDVEGFECEVLQGAEKTIQACRPVILVEVFLNNAAAVDALLVSFGYQKFFSFKEFDLLYVPV